MNRLNGKVALITGGGRGIGRAIALRFVSEGAAVMLAATRRDALEATAVEIRTAGGRAATAITDVADEGAVKAMVAATLAELGGLDILVNNAGVGGPTLRVVDMERADWDRTLAVNVTGAFLCAKHAIPHMIARKNGRIVNITSIAGLMGYPLRSPYAVSKWGMIALTRTLAGELGEQGITVNAIAPGAVQGERVEGVLKARAAALRRSEAEVAHELFIAPTALKRMVGPDDVAAAAAFLASDDAANITGETISVSAGFRA
ncbi:MAG TPA: SDR family NAD(P)-dependent oxidoreductase [Methylomirabilota bacterium]|nr:SDR family NAD(P)-dependent oxidoreductase [Methylomirabilota bacterium]